jgi:hypothetical protein
LVDYWIKRDDRPSPVRKRSQPQHPNRQGRHKSLGIGCPLSNLENKTVDKILNVIKGKIKLLTIATHLKIIIWN